jgi:hypothetical protein
MWKYKKEDFIGNQEKQSKKREGNRNPQIEARLFGE